jgi:hypothetical protein
VVSRNCTPQVAQTNVCIVQTRHNSRTTLGRGGSRQPIRFVPAVRSARTAPRARAVSSNGAAADGGARNSGAGERDRYDLARIFIWNSCECIRSNCSGMWIEFVPVRVLATGTIRPGSAQRSLKPLGISPTLSKVLTSKCGSRGRPNLRGRRRAKRSPAPGAGGFTSRTSITSSRSYATIAGLE